MTTATHLTAFLRGAVGPLQRRQGKRRAFGGAPQTVCEVEKSIKKSF
jgi:hypothetical protein